MANFDVEDAARRYLAGESTKDIGKATGVHFSTVRGRLIAHGIKMRGLSESGRLAKGIDLDMNEVVRRYEGGESACAIGKSLGVSSGIILDRLRERGAAIRDRKTAVLKAVRKPIGTAEVVARYSAGETIESIAGSLGVSMTPVRDRIVEAGVEMRTREEVGLRRRLKVDDAALVAAYEAGESELSISKRTGVSRPTIRRRLIEAGVTIRGGSEANLLRFSRMSPEERLALASASHAAIRGKRQSFEHRCKVALSVEANPKNVGPDECRLAAELRLKGIDVVPQKAVGPYNVDIALAESRIAVEVFGGNWHTTAPHAAGYRKRMDYLVDAGWLPVVVWVKTGWPLTGFATDYVVALHERLCRGEPRGRQEHVIRGNGDIGPVGEFKTHDGAIVLNFNPGNPTRREDGRFG